MIPRLYSLADAPEVFSVAKTLYSALNCDRENLESGTFRDYFYVTTILTATRNRQDIGYEKHPSLEELIKRPPKSEVKPMSRETGWYQEDYRAVSVVDAARPSRRMAAALARGKTPSHPL